MSDQSIVALIAIVVSGAVGVASLGFTFLNARNERGDRAQERLEDRREWYTRNLFEKRVDAAQGAMKWLDELEYILPHVQHGALHKDDHAIGLATDLTSLCAKIRDWHHSVSFYLPPELAGHLWGFLNSVVPFLAGAKGVPREDVEYLLYMARTDLSSFREALRAEESSMEAVREADAKRYKEELRRLYAMMQVGDGQGPRAHD